MHRVHRLPRVVFPAMVSRVKMLARMDIAERRRPQDGRFKPNIETMKSNFVYPPVPYGVWRKGRDRNLIQCFEARVRPTRFFPREMAIYKRMLMIQPGWFWSSDPREGKPPRCTVHCITSTHHESISSHSKTPSRTYTKPSTKSPCNPHWTHISTALKNVLRQDPDVVMVGEIRDSGDRRKCSTSGSDRSPSPIHNPYRRCGRSHRSNDRSGTLSILLSSVLVGVIAQRLVRRILSTLCGGRCTHRRTGLYLRLPRVRGRSFKIKHGEGCVRCRYTGYKGRTGCTKLCRSHPASHD